MKKAIFLLLAIGFTSFGVYSCQKDTANNAVDTATSNISVSDRYTDCDECAENCNDCCLTFTCTSGGVTFGYVNPATGLNVIKAFTSPGSTTVCAAGGWLAIFGTNGAGTITVCSTGETMSKAVGVLKVQKNLTWDCDIIP